MRSDEHISYHELPTDMICCNWCIIKVVSVMNLGDINVTPKGCQKFVMKAPYKVIYISLSGFSKHLTMVVKIIIPCVLILFLNICGLHAQISPNISLGSSTTAGSNASLRSLSGDFAFGFYALQSSVYLVGVWFDRIPE